VDVTVVVTTVGGPWLSDQLAALSRQTRPPAQLVVVNNGPAGAVDEVVDRWREAFPQLELIEERSASICGHARNVGAAHARQPGILFLDDDDVVAQGYVAAMGDALDRGELVAARIDLQLLNDARLVEGWGDMQGEAPMNTYQGFLPWVIGGAMGIRRETFLKVQGFDTSLLVGEDTDISWRAQLDAGARVVFVPDASISYRLRNHLRPALRQARSWAAWEVELYRRYRSRGLKSNGNQLRALLRWARPLVSLLRARRSEDVIVAARQFGACIGRLEGSVRHRHLHL
jgi:GT2 family glycosyltransferase